jgi:hypothetical protein
LPRAGNAVYGRGRTLEGVPADPELKVSAPGKEEAELVGFIERAPSFFAAYIALNGKGLPYKSERTFPFTQVGIQRLEVITFGCIYAVLYHMYAALEM